MILTVTLNPCLHKILTYRNGAGNGVVVKAVESRLQAGGKGINAARAVRALGGSARALTTIGGTVGRLFQETVEAEGLDLEAVEVAAPTRMSTFLFGAETGEFREYLEAGGAVSEREVASLQARFLELLPGAEVVALCGSVPDRRLDGFFAWAVGECKRARVRALVDTYGAHAPSAAAAAPFLFKANVDEVRDSFGIDVGRPDAIAAFARERIAAGCEHVVVTDGAEGAWLYSRDVALRARTPGIVEVNPVGCGDAMLGAMARCLARGDALERALRCGAAAGAANAESIGVCEFPSQRQAELERSVVVEPAAR